jgi:hypothetical protein
MSDTFRELLFMVNVGALAAGIAGRWPILAFFAGAATAASILFLMSRS